MYFFFQSYLKWIMWIKNSVHPQKSRDIHHLQFPQYRCWGKWLHQTKSRPYLVTISKNVHAEFPGYICRNFYVFETKKTLGKRKITAGGLHVLCNTLWWMLLHTEKAILNLVGSNKIQIVLTIFGLILNRTEFFLVPN